ncbi:flagellar protein FlaG [Vulcaniibacterium thermophilum]|uniref:Flagellar protein FlaG n=2 Tax=Gammaproteobacteria TaxID=1236 RepID=A0A918Z5X0_9GAMM|nr:flagellar protein FlaG [Vulcaniibacterium thermophilum]GHE37399.1 hypothetical protein GCM10007167_19440 [Vulcaniibacterium thermophilum]
MTVLPPLVPSVHAPSAPSPAASPAAPRQTPAAPAARAEPPSHAPAQLQAELDRFLQDSRTSLRFRIDRDTDRVVVTVLDAHGQPILQIPSETALRIARSLAATGRGLLDDEA